MKFALRLWTDESEQVGLLSESHTGAKEAMTKPATMASQTIPRACQNQAQKVTPQEYSWS